MGNPKDRDHADNDLASWVKTNCPELPDSMRNHIKTMTNLDGQGQDVLIRLILLAIRDKMPCNAEELFDANKIAEEMGNVIRRLSRGNGSSRVTAIDKTMEILQRYKEKQDST